MKELSIERKAKAYDEAIKRAREWYNELEPDPYTCIVESIFPEFKEIEDEKIRKRIIALVNAYGQGMYKDEMLAWLEKKGETSEVDGTFVNIDDVREDFIQEIYRILDADSTNDRANQIIGVFDGLPTVKFEKQGESNPYSGVSFKYNGHIWGMCARDNGVEILVDGEIKERVFLGSKPQGKSALEAINEEKVDNANKVELNDYSSIDPHFGKPIDNVEPKFHDGQWIVWQGKYFKVNYNGCRYELTDQNGKNTSLEYGTIDETAHLWNISDAKAGDVLATEDIVFIFKHKDKTGRSLCKSYCEVIGNSKLGLGFDFSINDVYPASKEQRELLHSKIKEAGYEWDAEKLELKKIKPEFWSDDVKKILNGFYINSDADIRGVQTLPNISNNYNVFATEKQAKSAFVMARISQIMANDVENFGGVITDEEWLNDEPKFVIDRYNNRINTTDIARNGYEFLAFHTAEQRDMFLEKYPQLVRDYLMIPEE